MSAGNHELVRFHVEDDHEGNGTNGASAYPAVVNNGGGHYAPVVPPTASAAPLVAVDKVNGAPVVLGRYPREALVTLRSAPFLFFLTVAVSVLFIGWFINEIILASMRDQTNYNGGRDTTGYLQILTGPLTTLNTDFYYGYGHEIVDVMVSFATCWAAVILATRQIRACALFATTWVMFSWLIYTRYIFQGLDKGFTFCQSQPNLSEGGFSYDYKWCRITMSNNAWSVMVEIVKVCAFLWALVMFVKTKGLEPYCELDRNDLEAVARQAARTEEEKRARQLSRTESIETVSTVPLGLAAAATPSHVRITTLSECHIDTPGKAVLLFCVLSTCGFIVSMLGNIELQRLGNDASTQPAFASGSNILVVGGPYGPSYSPTDGMVGPPVFSTLTGGLVHGLPLNTPTGDLNYNMNEIFTAFLLFFAVGLSVGAAYDRVRDNCINPLMVTFFSTLACFSYFIYAARRIHQSQNQQSIHPAFGSQVAIVVGLGITTCSEFFRLLCLIWKHSRALPAEAAVVVKVRKVFSTIYHVLNGLLVLTLIAYFIVLLAIQSEKGLFQYTPATAPILGQVPGGITTAIAPLAIPSAIATLTAAGSSASASQQSLLAVMNQIYTAAKTEIGTGIPTTLAFADATQKTVAGAYQQANAAALQAGADQATATATAQKTASTIVSGLGVVYAETLATIAGDSTTLAMLEATPTTADGQAAYAQLVNGVLAQGNATLFYANNPRQTYLLGQQTAEDVLVFPYQVFVISLLIVGWVIGMNFYARLREDRVGDLVSFTTITVQCAGWWLMCWPVAYSFAFQEGQAHKIFCRRDPFGSYLFTENVCQEGEAAGRLALIFWIILMLNWFVALIRWLTSDRDLPLMEVRIAAAMEARRVEQGLVAHDPNQAKIVMLADEKPTHSRIIKFFLFLSLGGWVLWACAVTRQSQRSFWMPVEDQLYPSIGFDLLWFIAVHYITVSTLISIFIHSHLASHPTLRHFHYFWRVAEFLGTMMNIILCVPVIIFMARQINTGITSEDQTAQFVGILILACSDFLQLVYCQALFRRYPLFTTPAEYGHFSKRHEKGHHTFTPEPVNTHVAKNVA